MTTTRSLTPFMNSRARSGGVRSVTSSSSDRGEPWQKHGRAETVDVDRDRRLECREEDEIVGGVLRRHPRTAPFRLHPDHAIRVPAYESSWDLESSHERERLLRERSPRQIAAEDDQIGLLALDLVEDGCERGRVAVHVGKRGDPHLLPGRSTGNRELVLGVDDALLELPAIRGRLARLDLLELGLRGLELCAGSRVVDLLHVHGVVDERERAIELDLEEARAGRELDDLVRAQVDPRRAGLERRDERRVSREHADLARGARHDDHLRLPVERRAVGRDERDVELWMRLCHRALRRDGFGRARLLDRVLDRADHVEGGLGELVVLAVDDRPEARDRVLELHVLARSARELLGDEVRLREEPLDAARPRDDDLVLVGELVHAEDRDDVLQVGVALEQLLDERRDLVVLVRDDARLQRARRRLEWIDRGVDALLDDRAVEHRRRVEVGERVRRRRVGEVVGGHVDRLHRRHRAGAGRRDPLLELAHLRRERRLVADGARHAAEERRDLRARLDEAEDVVDEEQHVLALVAEVLRHREPRQRDTEARSRRLVHLAVDERDLVEHAGLGHLEQEVVPLARPLADAREHGDAAVLLRDVVDELLDEDGLPDARAAEEADLAALHVRER